MKKYTIPVFIFLAIIALSSKASNAKDTGAFAVQEILGFLNDRPILFDVEALVLDRKLSRIMFELVSKNSSNLLKKFLSAFIL